MSFGISLTGTEHPDWRGWLQRGSQPLLANQGHFVKSATGVVNDAPAFECGIEPMGCRMTIKGAKNARPIDSRIITLIINAKADQYKPRG